MIEVKETVSFSMRVTPDYLLQEKNLFATKTQYMKQGSVFFAAVLAMVLTACVNNRQKQETMEQQVSTDSNTAIAPKAKETAIALPAFRIEDANGKILNLQSLKDKKVFVNLWASWCGPCRREMPSIEKLAHSVEKSKVAFVMLSLDDSFGEAKAFAQKHHLSLPLYYPAENLPAAFRVEAIPTTFIFDEQGNLVRRMDGSENYDSGTYRKLLQ